MAGPRRGPPSSSSVQPPDQRRLDTATYCRSWTVGLEVTANGDSTLAVRVVEEPDVAARAGVSKGTLYLYFDSKEALFRAVIEDSVLPLIDAIEAKVAALKDDPVRLLRELLMEW